MLLAILVFLFYCWACDTYIVDGKLVNVKKLDEQQARESAKIAKEIYEGTQFAPDMPEYDIPVKKNLGEWTYYQDMIGDTDDDLFS